MPKSTSSILIILLALSACATTKPVTSPISKRDERACEQRALVAQQQYLARVKTPMYTSSFSSTWAGGARSDTGQWVFDAALHTCVLHVQHAGENKK